LPYLRQRHARFALGTVVDDHERRFAACLVLGRDVNSDLPLVIDGVSFDDQRLGVFRIDLPEDLAGNPWEADRKGQEH